MRKTVSELSFVNRSRSTIDGSPSKIEHGGSLLSRCYSLDELPLAADLET